MAWRRRWGSATAAKPCSSSRYSPGSFCGTDWGKAVQHGFGQCRGQRSSSAGARRPPARPSRAGASEWMDEVIPAAASPSTPLPHTHQQGEHRESRQKGCTVWLQRSGTAHLAVRHHHVGQLQLVHAEGGAVPAVQAVPQAARRACAAAGRGLRRRAADALTAAAAAPAADHSAAAGHSAHSVSSEITSIKWRSPSSALGAPGGGATPCARATRRGADWCWGLGGGRGSLVAAGTQIKDQSHTRTHIHTHRRRPPLPASSWVSPNQASAAGDPPAAPAPCTAAPGPAPPPAAHTARGW
jgi:hypothetical protein